MRTSAKFRCFQPAFVIFESIEGCLHFFPIFVYRSQTASKTLSRGFQDASCLFTRLCISKSSFFLAMVFCFPKLSTRFKNIWIGCLLWAFSPRLPCFGTKYPIGTIRIFFYTLSCLSDDWWTSHETRSNVLIYRCPILMCIINTSSGLSVEHYRWLNFSKLPSAKVSEHIKTRRSCRHALMLLGNTCHAVRFPCSRLSGVLSHNLCFWEFEMQTHRHTCWSWPQNEHTGGWVSWGFYSRCSCHQARKHGNETHDWSMHTTVLTGFP